MSRLILIAALSGGLVSAQSPNVAGVWKADLQKSKIPGPPLKDYVEIIEQNGAKVTETSGSFGQRGEQRSVLKYSTDGKSTIGPYQGVPSRVTANWNGNTLVMKVETAGRPDVMTRSYKLSPDGQTLTITTEATRNGHRMQSTIVLQKQPDSAAEPLRTPEETAEKHFKNVKTATMKPLPASQFVDNMRYISWALNKECEFCHVKDKFDSDDKKEKRTARKMIDMTASINTENFKGKPEVRCYTCHEFHAKAQSRPRFEGEPEKKEDEHERPNEHTRPVSDGAQSTGKSGWAFSVSWHTRRN
ncbi:MAG: photosynthetic reaction center cytochrome c subunit [Acidobacteriaceae bacterium]|nr:photosynthetic reaction center cytochrome c subunit [Acidobacteriaceae bacterium]